MKLGFCGLAFGVVSFGIACCGVTSLGNVVRFGAQSNIIVWDPVTKTEHFVRNASFVTKAKDFGFIAPTPSKPQLAKADAAAFTLLARLQPAHDHPADSDGAKAAGSISVKVIEVKDVAGYRATVLKANDAQALSSWMSSNGYHTTESIREWTDYYIQKGWYLTAFKVLNKEEVAQTGVVRLSFKTDRPFNPYYVPKDNLAGAPTVPLTLFFVAPGIYQPKTEAGEAWSSGEWTVPLAASDAARLEDCLKLNAGEVPAGSVVTSYTDYSFPNGTHSDLYFDLQESTVRTRDGMANQVTGAAFVLVGAGAWILWRRRG